MLTIYRETGLSDKTRGFNIIIDGKKVGKIKEGETFCLQFNDQNNHTLQLKIDWCSSIVQEFNGNEDVCFYCKTCIQTKIQIFLFKKDRGGYYPAFVYLFPCWGRSPQYAL